MRLRSKAAQGRGLTLIELMISIAILAIFLAIPMAGFAGSRALTREDDYRWALTNARSQKEWLEGADFDRLPPERRTVTADGSVQLSQTDIVSATISVDGRPAPAMAFKNSKLWLGKKRAGQTVIVNYEFALPDRNEAHYLDDKHQIVLKNGPVLKVEAAWLAERNKLRPLRPTASNLHYGLLTFKDTPPGSLVIVDYRGQRWNNRVRASFLDDSLQPSSTPSDVKLLEVREQYGGAWRMSLPLLKARS